VTGAHRTSTLFNTIIIIIIIIILIIEAAGLTRWVGACTTGRNFWSGLGATLAALRMRFCRRAFFCPGCHIEQVTDKRLSKHETGWL
jgi:hypothetical protein